MLSSEQLQQIRDREQAATEGPWNATYICETDDWRLDVGGPESIVESDGKPIVNFCCDAQGTTEDADFIAHSREDIPALLDAVEELQRENEALRKASSKVAGWFEGQAKRNDEKQRTCDFSTLKNAYRLDAANYRKMAKDLREAADVKAKTEESNAE